MSEMDDWKRESAGAKGVLGLAIMGVVGGAIKLMSNTMDNAAGKAEAKSRYEKEKSRLGLDKMLHKKDYEQAKRDYEKYKWYYL